MKGIKEPTVTYVVVGKRHHIRFFPERGMKDKSGNCPSGFVTDDPCITSPHVYDFFLQSHAGLLGSESNSCILLDVETDVIFAQHQGRRTTWYCSMKTSFP